MIGRILCALGFHGWDTYHRGFMRICRRCGLDEAWTRGHGWGSR